MKRKHTVINTTDFPQICELCGKQFENINAIKKHMKEQTYKNAKIKCEECDFIGQNEITMEVHYGKFHSKNFDCGICDNEAKSLANLQMHLFTCEMFKCSVCEKKVKGKHSKPIKPHVITVHNDSCGIEHLKINRNKLS